MSAEEGTKQEADCNLWSMVLFENEPVPRAVRDTYIFANEPSGKMGKSPSRAYWPNYEKVLEAISAMEKNLLPKTDKCRSLPCRVLISGMAKEYILAKVKKEMAAILGLPDADSSECEDGMTKSRPPVASSPAKEVNKKQLHLPKRGKNHNKKKNSVKALAAGQVLDFQKKIIGAMSEHELLLKRIVKATESGRKIPDVESKSISKEIASRKFQGVAYIPEMELETDVGIKKYFRQLNSDKESVLILRELVATAAKNYQPPPTQEESEKSSLLRILKNTLPSRIFTPAALSSTRCGLMRKFWGAPVFFETICDALNDAKYKVHVKYVMQLCGDCFRRVKSDYNAAKKAAKRKRVNPSPKEVKKPDFPGGATKQKKRGNKRFSMEISDESASSCGDGDEEHLIPGKADKRAKRKYTVPGSSSDTSGPSQRKRKKTVTQKSTDSIEEEACPPKTRDKLVISSEVSSE